MYILQILTLFIRHILFRSTFIGAGHMFLAKFQIAKTLLFAIKKKIEGH